MGVLYVHGDYGRVTASALEGGDVARIGAVPGRWGIGLGADPGGDGLSRFGEALAAGRVAAVLPSGSLGAPRVLRDEFDSGYLAAWDAEEAACYYVPRGSGWSLRSVLEQMYAELSRLPGCPGLYGFCGGGTFDYLDVQALVLPPFAENAPGDGRPINAGRNYARFLRHERRAGLFPFVCGGLFLKAHELDLRDGGDLIGRAFGPSLPRAALHYHAHAALLGGDVRPEDVSADSPRALEDLLSERAGEVVSVEHLRDDTSVFEAHFFIVPLHSIEPARG